MARKTRISSIFRGIAAAATVALLAAGALFYLQSTSRGNDGTAELAALSQAVAVHAGQALGAEAGGFDRLANDLDRLTELTRGAVPPGSGGDWRQLEESGGAILAERPDVQAINEAASMVVTAAGGILGLSDDLLQQSGATAILQEVQLRALRLSRVPTGLAASGQAADVARVIADDTQYLTEVVNALNGEESRLDVRPLGGAARDNLLAPLGGHMADLAAAAYTIESTMDSVAGLAGELDAARAASAALLDDAFSGSGTGSSLPALLATPWVPIGLVVAAALFVLALFVLNAKSAVFERKAREQADQNERNQQAILRLLDEMGSLADGDLTVQATVTEDITGTIADSFNFAIEELRSLVATVNETAIMVDSAAKQTENTAAHMARAAENQTREINAASESIVSMASSIEEVSGNAERSSDVARHSVDVAHKGGEAVRRTIDGMNTIRETIQETSKRIKRLGESSQEIGNIVELINDIAEQTNILALNASIQASMAGEAGRGFAVVADEVQRLAERSTNATRQIEVLVSTIQADTKEAVVSMERSTTDVVGGALLAENAGAALDEIEQVSNQIANLVQNISGSAKQQAGAAADVTRRTKRLSEISEQTGKATTATAAAISKLSEFASQLRQSVAGFTLPESPAPQKTVRVAAKELAPAKAPPKPAPTKQPPNKAQTG